jgi:hypothetical protein
MEQLSPGDPGPITNPNENKIEISENCREIITDVQRMLDGYYPSERDLNELEQKVQKVLRTFTGVCALVTIANIDDPEQKIAFRNNPAEAHVVIKFAINTTDFDKTAKNDLLERATTLNAEDVEAIFPAIQKLQLLRISGPTEVFRSAMSEKLNQDPDLSMADALIKMGMR